MDKGKIILLNGVSSSGKSTLGLALQDTLPEKYFLSLKTDSVKHGRINIGKKMAMVSIWKL